MTNGCGTRSTRMSGNDENDRPRLGLERAGEPGGVLVEASSSCAATRSIVRSGGRCGSRPIAAAASASARRIVDHGSLDLVGAGRAASCPRIVRHALPASSQLVRHGAEHLVVRLRSSASPGSNMAAAAYPRSTTAAADRPLPNIPDDLLPSSGNPTDEHSGLENNPRVIAAFHNFHNVRPIMRIMYKSPANRVVSSYGDLFRTARLDEVLSVER